MNYVEGTQRGSEVLIIVQRIAQVCTLWCAGCTLHPPLRSAVQCSGGCTVGAQHCTAQHCTALHSTAQHGTALHCTAQHSTAQHSTAQHCTAQHSTAQHSTALHSTGLHSTAQHRTAQHTITEQQAVHSERIGHGALQHRGRGDFRTVASTLH